MQQLDTRAEQIVTMIVTQDDRNHATFQLCNTRTTDPESAPDTPEIHRETAANEAPKTRPFSTPVLITATRHGTTPRGQ
jgi:hypothetical protein